MINYHIGLHQYFNMLITSCLMQLFCHYIKSERAPMGALSLLIDKVILCK